VDDFLATTNADVYAVGDVVSGTPRLTHVAGEHAKVAVQNALFNGRWRHTELTIPACTYTEPELATVGINGAAAAAAGLAVDEYEARLEGNDRAILEGEESEGGFVRIVCKQGSGQVVGATVCAGRAGEIINEISLAIKADLGLEMLGRNIHPYPTTGEAVMGCGLQWINARWQTLS